MLTNDTGGDRLVVCTRYNHGAYIESRKTLLLQPSCKSDCMFATQPEPLSVGYGAYIVAVHMWARISICRTGNATQFFIVLRFAADLRAELNVQDVDCR